MFNFINLLFDIVKSSGTSAVVGGINTEGILILGIVFITGMFTQYAFTKIKEYLKERKTDKKDDDKRE